jgi:hypothetical protein
MYAFSHARRTPLAASALQKSPQHNRETLTGVYTVFMAGIFGRAMPPATPVFPLLLQGNSDDIERRIKPALQVGCGVK